MGHKLEGTNVTVGKLLYQLKDAEKMEWLFNNLLYRQGLQPEVRALLPSGTTSNEALHAEMNGWFRGYAADHLSLETTGARFRQAPSPPDSAACTDHYADAP